MKRIFLFSLAIGAISGIVQAQTVVTLCSSGCNYPLDHLQEALDDAQPGWIIEIKAGQTATALVGLRLRNKGITEGPYITLRSSGMADLPGGKRVTPADKPKLATITYGFPGYNVMYGEQGAAFYRFEGIEFKPLPGEGSTNMIEFATFLGNGVAEIQVSQLPHDLVFDRCYLHGHPRTNGPRRAILANTGKLEIMDSWIEDIKDRDNESQAVAGWNDIGPFYFRNNHLSAASITTLFGGAVPIIKGIRATGLFFQGNHYYKPWTWRSLAGVSNPTGVCLWDENGGEYFRNITNNTFWQCNHGTWGVISPTEWDAGFPQKNQFELKNAAQALVEGNLIENGWLPGFQQQRGAAILINQVDNATLTGEQTASVTNVEFRYNVARNTPYGITMGRIGDYEIPIHDIVFTDNLLYRIGEEPQSQGEAVILQTTLEGALRLSNNTAIMKRSSGGYIVALSAGPSDMHAVYGNIFAFNQFGFYNSFSGAGALWNAIDTAWNPNRMVSRNVVINNQNTSIFGDIFPKINLQRNADSGRTNCLGCGFPAGFVDVQFEDSDNDDYRLKPGGPFKNWSHLGQDAGADMDAVKWATKNAIDGEYNPFFEFLIRDLRPGQNTLDLSYVAYDQQSCRLTVSNRFDYATIAYDAPDAGGDQDRSQTVTGLAPNTRYFYKLVCGTEGYREIGRFSDASLGSILTADNY